MLHSLRLGMVLGSVLLLTVALSAAEPTGKADAEQIARWIAQLGSNQFAEREAATQALDALGPAALEALRRVIESDDAEVRRRAQKLIRQIDKRAATARLLEPKRLRLIYNDKPVTEAVADLAQKTGMPFRFAGDPGTLAKRRLTLDTGDTTFWDAVAQFCQKAGLFERGLGPEAFEDERYQYSSGERKIIALDRTSWGYSAQQNSPYILMDGKGPTLPTCHAGALRIRALSAGSNHTKAEGETLLVLEVMPEPHLQWQSVLGVRIDKATDEQGQVLKQRVMASGLGATVGSAAEEMLIIWDGVGEFPANPFGDARHVPVRFRLGDKPSKQFKELSGTIVAQVRTPPEPLATVDNILEAAGRSVKAADGSSLHVIEAKRTAEGAYLVRVGVASPAPELVNGGVPARILLNSRAWWGRGQSTGGLDGTDFVLLDAKDRRLTLTRSEVQGTLGKSISHDFTLLFQPPSDASAPVRLQYIGRRRTTIEVPFTLKDVPLP